MEPHTFYCDACQTTLTTPFRRDQVWNSVQQEDMARSYARRLGWELMPKHHFCPRCMAATRVAAE